MCLTPKLKVKGQKSKGQIVVKIGFGNKLRGNITLV